MEIIIRVLSNIIKRRDNASTVVANQYQYYQY